MSDVNRRWMIRYIDIMLTFWFTVWLFWIHKPVWRWVFLVWGLLEAWDLYRMGKSAGFEEYE
jgi:hypothetical protein